MEYTRTQLMKLGTVVKVWYKSSESYIFNFGRRIAKAIGSQLVAIPRPLMARVFFSTRTISLTVAGFSNSSVNHLEAYKIIHADGVAYLIIKRSNASPTAAGKQIQPPAPQRASASGKPELRRHFEFRPFFSFGSKTSAIWKLPV